MEPAAASSKQRIRSTTESQRKAILLRTQGLSLKQAADKEGLGERTLKRWRSDYRDEQTSSMGSANEGLLRDKVRKPGHLWVYAPLKRLYDEKVSTKGWPPAREWLQEQAELLHQGQRGCSCGKEHWRPSCNWMRSWYAALSPEMSGSSEELLADSMEVEEGGDESTSMDIEMGTEQLEIPEGHMPTQINTGGGFTVRLAPQQQQRLVAVYQEPIEDDYMPLRSGNEWTKVFEADQPRELVPLFQRLAKTPDGRNYPLSLADSAISPFQVNISCYPQPLIQGHYQAPSRRGVFTPEHAGRLAYTSVLHHEHCFRTALGDKWGAGITFRGLEPQNQPNRLPLLNDPEVACCFSVPPFEFLTKGASAVSVTALGIVQAMCGITVRPDVCTTGCLDLHGNILAIGSIRDKVVVAYNHGLPIVAAPWISLEALDERQRWVREQMAQADQKKAKAATVKHKLELLPDEVLANVQLHPLHTMVDLLRLAAPDLGLPADFELYAGPGLTKCNIIMCNKEEGGIAWIELATTPAATQNFPNVEFLGALSAFSVNEAPFVFEAVKIAALQVMPRWQQITGLPIKLDFDAQVDKETGRVFDLLAVFQALNSTLPYSNAYATGIIAALLALGIGRHLPNTLAFGNGINMDHLLYPAEEMGEVEVKVARRAGIKTLILQTDNANQVRAAALAEGADLEVLGADSVEDLMMLIKDRLMTPRELQEAQQPKGGRDEEKSDGIVV